MLRKLAFVLFIIIILVTGSGRYTALFSQEEAAGEELIEGEGDAAVISLVTGGVEVRRVDETEWNAALQGQVINVGDRIRTKADSTVEIEFESGALSSLESYSEMGVKSAVSDYDNDEYETTLDLMIGKILVNVKRIKNEDLSFNVETPVAVAAVRGTEFLVDAMSGDDTDVAVFNGTVKVRKKGLSGFVVVKKNKKINIKKKTIKLREPFKIDKKTLGLKKKFIELRKKAITFRKKKLGLKRKKIKLRIKEMKLKDKPKIKEKKGKIDLKGNEKLDLKKK